MTRLERLEREIAELSAAELEEFRAWFADFESSAWDRQIECDEASGRLDSLAGQAPADHRARRTKPL